VLVCGGGRVFLSIAHSCVPVLGCASGIFVCVRSRGLCAYYTSMRVHISLCAYEYIHVYIYIHHFFVFVCIYMYMYVGGSNMNAYADASLSTARPCP